ncbi:hypothetical protein QJS10_CPA06g00274 [Acorus calamus]|uniref:Uncharacterized protein n=1 Tax=Acorus calamus TaxID=4465 RepID=A0AAV9EJD9_ACOCL|nr:hypothetical protein QJS10_CPA06g00274 [Acorus calamus]
MEAEIEQVRSVLGPEPLESDILRALSLAGNNPNRAINIILDTPGFLTPRPPPVKLSTVGSGSRISASVKQEQLEEGDISNGQVKKEPDMGSDDKGPILKPFHGGVKKEELDVGLDEKSGVLVPFKRDENFVDLTKIHHTPYLNPCPISSVNLRRSWIGGFRCGERGVPEERDWFLLGRTTVTGMSTCKGRKLEFNEIVHFAFPSADGRTSYRKPWVSAKAAAASLEIVRFSTKRNGEIGRLPKEWTRILIPLVNSSKAEFTPEELDNRKRTLNLTEMDPPDALLCDLRSYQKQALYWMSELEKGVDVEQAAKTLHPC